MITHETVKTIVINKTTDKDTYEQVDFDIKAGHEAVKDIAIITATDDVLVIGFHTMNVYNTFMNKYYPSHYYTYAVTKQIEVEMMVEVKARDEDDAERKVHEQVMLKTQDIVQQIELEHSDCSASLYGDADIYLDKKEERA